MVGRGACSVPERWTEYIPLGRRMPGTRFIAFKVPLKESFDRNLLPEERFSPHDLIRKVEERQEELGLVIDLTYTTRYYSREELPATLRYYKILTMGREIPNRKTILRFKYLVKKFLTANKDNDKLIGVHCTHGLNRTGYLVCRYLIDVEGMEPNAAIELFNKCRGHPIERTNYIQDLQKRALKNCEVKSLGSDLSRSKGSAPAKPQKQLVKPPLAVPRNPGSSKKKQWPDPTAQEQPQELGHRHGALGQGQLQQKNLEQRQLENLEQKQLKKLEHLEQRQRKKQRQQKWNHLEQDHVDQEKQMKQNHLEQKKQMKQNHLEQRQQQKWNNLEQNHLEQDHLEQRKQNHLEENHLDQRQQKKWNHLEQDHLEENHLDQKQQKKWNHLEQDHLEQRKQNNLEQRKQKKWNHLEQNHVEQRKQNNLEQSKQKKWNHLEQRKKKHSEENHLEQRKQGHLEQRKKKWNHLQQNHLEQRQPCSLPPRNCLPPPSKKQHKELLAPQSPQPQEPSPARKRRRRKHGAGEQETS
ncbi:PREDICTED: RNA/RNP complex-1-interacting phosphatase [Ficedula albicollis]|uniref:RNA/RNP complex-1-interacting phosphatase n=1 Tax=Ficedula albicollis TaxID=59894 RepID=UPI0007AD93C2|nr:PREDICTED: RNA/RNP complex-1-interacting phosphatase [Ficedula albicollis]